MRERTTLNDTINGLKDELAASSNNIKTSQTGNDSALSKMQQEFKALNTQAAGETGYCVRVCKIWDLRLWTTWTRFATQHMSRLLGTQGAVKKERFSRRVFFYFFGRQFTFWGGHP
jgi:hypothetical protein